MKQFVCHKRVKAAKIVKVEKHRIMSDPEYTDITMDDGQFHTEISGAGMFSRYEPKEGDYLVEYEPDGYRSISPKAAFEEGYREFTPEAAS